MTSSTQHNPSPSPARPHTLGRSRGAALLVVALAAAVGGCSKPLLSSKDQRSPFDRYDKARNQFAQQEIEDAYGRKTPNLEGRLTPKDE